MVAKVDHVVAAYVKAENAGQMASMAVGSVVTLQVVWSIIAAVLGLSWWWVFGAWVVTALLCRVLTREAAATMALATRVHQEADRRAQRDQAAHN